MWSATLEAAGQRGEQALVVLAERVRPVDVLERQDAGGAFAEQQRDEERRLGGVAAQHDWIAVPFGHLRCALLEKQGLARFHDVLAEADQRYRLLVEALTAFDHVRETQQPARLIVDRDAHDLGVEDRLELVSDEVVDRLRIELAGDRRLDAVDQRKLGITLTRLVNELRVVERDPQAAGDRRQQSLIGLVERVLPIEVLGRDHAGRPPTHQQRLEDRGTVRGLTSDRLRVVVLDERRVHVRQDGERLACLHHVFPESDDWQRHVREMDAAFDLIDVAEDPRVFVMHCDVDDLRVEDVPQLRADHVVDRLLVEFARD